MTGDRPIYGDERTARVIADSAYDHMTEESQSLGWLLKAVVHAILHLADQARIANLLRLSEQVDTEACGQALQVLIDERGYLRPDIARTLGVTANDGRRR